MPRTKRKYQPIASIDVQPYCKKIRQEKISLLGKRRMTENKEHSDKERDSKQRCLSQMHNNDTYIDSNYGMVSFTPQYIQQLKESYSERSYLGLPAYQCKHCEAVFWYNECNKKETYRNKHPTYTNCCKNGKIKIPPYKEPPAFLWHLVNDKEDEMSKHFLQKIRQYNSLFAFTSMGTNIIIDINKGEGPYVFRINGQIHHRIGSLLPKNGQLPQYAELYIFDTKNEIKNRIKALHREDPQEIDIDPRIVEELKNMLDKCNPLVKIFRHARDLLEQHKGIDISIRILGADKGDAIQYEMPHPEDLAMLIVGDLTLERHKRDIIVSSRSKGLQHITIFHPAYMALQYPLLFPYGERGFQLGIPYHENKTSHNKPTKRYTMTMHEYYKYQVHYRPNQPNPFLCYGRLSKQAIVDARAMEDEDRLAYIARNQDKLRCEYLQGVFDAIDKGLTESDQIGKKTLLPSSHTGCKRYVIQNYHDGIAICRVYGPPDLFVTFTCNPKWQEIVDTIKQGEQPSDRPDIIVRVFHMKLQELIEDIWSGQLFGPILAILYSIEFQKRGLPHVHIIIWIDKKNIVINAEVINSWISAEIPDPKDDPLGYVLVSEHMLHGPCGDKNEKCPYMKKGKCSKFYPKDFVEETTFTDNGFTLYRRRQNNIYIRKGNHNLDNR